MRDQFLVCLSCCDSVHFDSLCIIGPGCLGLCRPRGGWGSAVPVMRNRVSITMRAKCLVIS
jgi:hypothetical protein